MISTITNFKKIFGEWELMLFVLSLLCSGVYLYATGTGKVEEEENSASAATEYEAADVSDTLRLFNFVFPEELSSYNLKKANNPFYFKHRDLPKRNTGKSSADEEESGKDGDEDDEAADKDEKDTAEKDPQHRLYRIKYCGSINGDEGKGIALVKNVKEDVMHYAAKDSRVLEVKIVECSNKGLTIQLPSGENKSLKFGETVTYKVKQ